MIKLALRKPISIIVVIMGILLFSFMAVKKIAIDIFPFIDLPTIYVSQPYGGMSPEQMEALLSTRYEDQFLYVTGIKHIEVKNIQGTSLLKLSFYEGTNMAQAAGEVATLVNRSQAFMPPGTVPPIVIRFDASSLPVGQLVFSAANRNLNDLQLAAQRFVRPMFSSIPGVSSPPPFGGSSRTIVVRANPELLRSHNTTADEVVEAISKNNQIAAAGNVRIGDYSYMTPANTLVDQPEELLNIPIRTGSGPAVYVRDIGTVQDAGDVITSYALVNGRRAVYIPVLKRADASTWSVVQNIKAALPKMQAAIPEDIKISYEFDQSVYVINAVKSLMTEGITGALLTGLMVLLFLGDFKSSIIVILTIPISVLAAVLLLFLFGQTINIMTLSGLALAIGILVDQATVAIENIHQHLEMGKTTARAVFDAIKEVSFPLFLILLCVLAVFAPAFMMTGVPKSMFLPISLSVGFAMIVSFLLSQTFVPILANWLLKGHKPHKQESHFALDTTEEQMVKHEERVFEAKSEKKLKGFQLFRHKFTERLKKLMERRKLVITCYVIGVFGLIGICFYTIGEDILPKVNSGQFQVRLRAPDGTRLERTEQKLLQVIDIIKKDVGPENVAITSAFVGTQPNTYPEAAVYQFMSGTHEALLQVNLDENYHVKMDELKERLRHKMKEELPELRVSFEPIELVDKVMSQGSPTPVEIMVAGKDLNEGKTYAYKVKQALDKISFLRDVQIAQPINYPVINIHIDRDRAGQMGLTPAMISKSLVASTSSSRYTNKVFWLDHKIGVGYQIQLQVPEPIMKDMNDIENISLLPGQIRPVLGDVATMSIDTVPGEYDHYDSKRVITITANIYNKDLNTAAKAVNKALAGIGQLPRGMEIKTKGLIPLLEDMLGSLQNGLLVAIVVIFLLLSATYQSFKVSFAVLSTIPAVLAGSLIMLLATGSTLNLQSYMGIIMSVGVSVANAILLVTNAEHLRRTNGNAPQAAITAASIRLRPILMTSVAMIVGMIPMAAGLGEAGEQSAPLGRAVIGGLLASTASALLILPCVFAQIQNKTSTKSISLDPEDAESKYYSLS